MASAFTHAIVAVTSGKLLGRSQLPARFWVLAVLCAILPDVDSIGFFLGVPYGHPFGHRGFTHSLLFALIIGLVVSSLCFPESRLFSKRWLKMTFVFFLITASHGVLDAMTDGGRGIAFFAPFDNSRQMFPWQPLVVSPIGIRPFFSEWGLRVLVSEALWIWLPCLVLILIFRSHPTANPSARAVNASRLSKESRSRRGNDRIPGVF
jgi:inner membrane protein